MSEFTQTVRVTVDVKVSGDAHPDHAGRIVVSSVEGQNGSNPDFISIEVKSIEAL